MMAGTTNVDDTEQLLTASRGCSELASLVRIAGDFPRSDLDEAAASLSGANWDGQLGGALKHLAARWMDHQCEALHATYRALGQKTWDTWSAYTGAERTNTATFNDAHADIRATFG
ncbi:hypothetical protein ACM01_30900 [Streptomyces viridochromogenes]|uniref:Uncharacterized protein n=1 Tax=Streptomyces viridochromogenes TaxID=1938 RepID=A0A0J7Z3E8_STRVR|nr:hypothetical protein [Streptomyces viridochromogenes]KMS70541.1 hypothetical protein ACM01_30900 [Streptomyces viridochromogenes]